MRILIVGGGIAGLAAALALRRVDVERELIERASAWQSAGAGIYLPGNGVAALRRLGLDGPVIAIGAVVERRRLPRILVAANDDLPMRFGVTIASLEDRPDGAHVAFDDGSSATYDLVIGADGAHSELRRSVFGGPVARPAGQVGWRFVVDGHPRIDSWNGWLGRDRGFLALGIGGGRVYGVGDLRSTDGIDPTGGDPEAFAALFHGYPEPVPSLLAGIRSPDDLWFSPFEEVAPPTWSSGHVVLIGDAAHATAPNMAEGASLAIEDALVLAECLAAAGGDHALAIGAFIERRMARVMAVQRMTRRRDRLRYLHPWLRRAVMGIAGPATFRAHYHPLLAPP